MITSLIYAIISVLVGYLVYRIYVKVASDLFVRKFQLVDDILYKDKLPFDEAIKIQRPGLKIWFGFNEGKLHDISLHMKDGASVYWRANNRYTTCYSKDGKAISQSKFETLYDIFVDINSLLSLYNKHFPHAQLTCT